MWESGRLSRERVDGMAGASLVVVPCEWCAIVFDACGVAPPIEVVPMGYDQAVFSPPRRRAPRPPGRPFKVGSAARAAHGGLRKGLDDAVAAFQAAFPDGRGAAMEVKVFPDDPAPEPGGGVQVLRGVWPERHLATWYRSLDVFLSMSRGEGFGLMPLQAMACGTPVVAVVAGGHAEYMREGGAVPVPYTLERSEEAMPGNGYYEGFWFRPDVDAAAQILRMLAAEDGLRAALGEAAVRAAAAFQWAVHDSRLAEVLARHGWPVTPPPPDPYSSPYGP
jgi:glycosyltransferase involved in cell wall biosynthesis